jgi:hypothetical protein
VCCRRAASRRCPSCRSPLVLPQLPDEAREALGPDPHLQCVLLHVDPLNEQLDNARLLGGEQLAPDRGEVGEQDGDLALGDLAVALLGGGPGRRDQLWRGQQFLDLVE